MLVGIPAHIAGADGCKAGWIALTADPEALDKAQVKIFKNFAELISKLPAHSIIAIDMPIGLPERGQVGAASRTGRPANFSLGRGNRFFRCRPDERFMLMRLM